MRLRSFIPLAILFFLLLTAIIYGFIKFIQPKFASQKDMRETQVVTKGDVISTCKPDDDVCNRRNEKIKISRLEGSAVTFAKHQCDGPRACPTPEPQVSEAAISAIRAFAKDTNLELIQVTGITARGLLYYCGSNSRCWVYDTKAKKVTAVETDTVVSPTSEK